MYTLVIGDKNLSSWSLRPWILLRHLGLPFTELRLPLDTPRFHAEIHRWSPTGRVPVLLDGDLRVWDSIAICEYLSERAGGAGWPEDAAARAVARAVSAEMHAGFAALRGTWSSSPTRRWVTWRTNNSIRPTRCWSRFRSSCRTTHSPGATWRSAA